MTTVQSVYKPFCVNHSAFRVNRVASMQRACGVVARFRVCILKTFPPYLTK